MTAAEAQAHLGVGLTVVGLLPDGGEVRAYQTTTTVYEDEQVLKEVCEPEYDHYSGEYETKCHSEYVTEQRPTQKKVFQLVSTFTMLDFPNALAAVNRASGFGVTAWRAE